MAENQVAKIHGILSKFDTAMLITHASGESARVRPMAIARVDPDW